MTLVLGIESTCDETGAAIVHDGRHVLSNVVASQVELHARYRGVVPEIASRAHIENMLPVIREATRIAGVPLERVDALAVAHRPGLIGSLLIGVTAAKTLAWSLGKPLIGVDHVQAHLHSVILDNGSSAGIGALTGGRTAAATNDDVAFPAVGLVCSGGHTALYELRSFTDMRRIGSTIDDAVGEAYDKVAAILGLGYPGGPIIDRLAAKGNPTAVKFPRSLLGRHSLDFSFSGLKTSVLYHVRGVPGRQQTMKHSTGPNAVAPELSDEHVADVAASFQAACIDVLREKLHRGLRSTHGRSVLIGGGVSANRGLRQAMESFDVPVCFPSPAFCTDNAAMIGGLGHLLYTQGHRSALDLDAITYSAIGSGALCANPC